MAHKNGKKRKFPVWANPGRIVYFKPESMPEQIQADDPLLPEELAYVAVVHGDKLLCVKVLESDGSAKRDPHPAHPATHEFDEEQFFPTFSEALRAAAKRERDWAEDSLRVADLLEKWASEHEQEASS